MLRIHTLRLLAIAPVVIVAIINTGYQYLLALDVNDGIVVGNWRDGIVQSFNIDYLHKGIYDIVAAGLIHVLPTLAIAILTGGIWQRVFAERRNRDFDSGFIYTALLFTMLMPPEVAFFHVIFGMSFAIVLAEAVFGGEGKTFLSPALVGVTIVQVTFPSALIDHPIWTSINGYAGSNVFAVYHQQGMAGLVWDNIDWWSAFIGNVQGLIGTTSVLAILMGAMILMIGHVASWRLLVGQLVGVILIATLCNISGEGILALPWYWHAVLGSFAFCAVFICTDPASSAATDTGRWIQGFLVGALVVLIRVINPSHPDSVIPVMLLVSMLAPLIDHVVIWFNIRRRSLGRG